MKKQLGFTLIEILVVISIIGILTALLLANFVGIRERASDSKLKTDATQLKNALRLYYNDFQGYPDAATKTSIAGCGTNGDQACVPGAAFSAGSATYMKEIPLLSYYERLNSGDGFVACVSLQNEGDTDIGQTKAVCLAAASDKSTAGATAFCVCND